MSMNLYSCCLRSNQRPLNSYRSLKADAKLKLIFDITSGNFEKNKKLFLNV